MANKNTTAKNKIHLQGVGNSFLRKQLEEEEERIRREAEEQAARQAAQQASGPKLAHMKDNGNAGMQNPGASAIQAMGNAANQIGSAWDSFLKNVASQAAAKNAGGVSALTRSLSGSPHENPGTDSVRNFVGLVNDRMPAVQEKARKIGSKWDDFLQNLTNPAAKPLQEYVVDPKGYLKGNLPESRTYGQEKDDGNRAGWGNFLWMYNDKNRQQISPEASREQSNYASLFRNKGLYDNDEKADPYLWSDSKLARKIAELEGQIEGNRQRTAGQNRTLEGEDAGGYLDDEGMTAQDRADELMQLTKDFGRLPFLYYRNGVPMDSAPKEYDEQLGQGMFQYIYGEDAFAKETAANGGKLSAQNEERMRKLWEGSLPREEQDYIEFQNKALQQQVDELKGIQQRQLGYEKMIAESGDWAATNDVEAGYRADVDTYNAADITGKDRAAALYNFFGDNTTLYQTYIKNGNDNLNSMDSMASAFDHAYFYTPKEKAIFQEYMNAGDKEAALAFHQGLVDSRVLENRYMDWKQDTWKMLSDITPITSGAATVAGNKLGAVMGTAGQLLKLAGVDSVDHRDSAFNALTAQTQTMRENIAQNAGDDIYKLTGSEFLRKLASTATNSAFSGIDSGTDYLIGKWSASLLGNLGLIKPSQWRKTAEVASLGNMFLEVFQNSYYQNLEEKPDDPDYARISGLLDAAQEVFWETVGGVDFAFKEGQQAWKYGLGMMLGEIIEEEGGAISSPIVNSLKDNIYKLATTGETNWNMEWDDRAMELYRSNPEKYAGEDGMKQAYHDVLTGYVAEMGWTAVGTLFSTAPKAAGAGAGMYGEYAERGKRITENGQLDALAEMAAQSEDAEIRKRGEAIQERQKNGKKTSNREIGSLWAALSGETETRISDEQAKAMERSIRGFIRDTYGDRVEATEQKRLTEIAAKAAEEGTKALTMQERRMLDDHAAVKDLVKDLTSREGPDSAKRSFDMLEGADADAKARTAQLEENARKLMEMGRKTSRSIAEAAQTMMENIRKGAETRKRLADMSVKTAEARTASAEEIQAAGIVAEDGKAARGKAVVTAEGQEAGQSAEIVGRENGQYILKTEDGTEIRAEAADVKAADKVTGAAMTFAEETGMTDQEATDLLDVVRDEAVTEENVGKVLENAQGMMARGFIRDAVPQNIEFDPKIARKLYEKGAALAKAAETKRAEGAETRGWSLKPGEGTAEWRNVTREDLNGTQQKQTDAAEAIAKRLGFNVIFENDVKNRNRFGEYDAIANAVVINTAGLDRTGIGHHMLVTLSHEMTHMLEHGSPKAYTELRDFVFDEIRKNGGDAAARIQQKMEAYNHAIARMRENGEDVKDIDMAGAVAEVVADACDQVLGNEKLIQQLADEKPNVFQKMKEIVRDWITKIREAVAGMKASRSIDSVFMKNVDELAKKWGIALQETQGAEASTETSTETGTVAEEQGQGTQMSLAEMDDEYLTAAENGDEKTASSMVERAAKAAGYTTPKLYHGTGAFGFTKFDLEMGEQLIFATTDRRIGETYSGETSRSRIHERTKLDVDNLHGEELLNAAKENLGKYKDYRLATAEDREEILYEPKQSLTKAISRITEYAEENKNAFDKEKRSIVDRIVKSLEEIGKTTDSEQMFKAWNEYDSAVWDLKWMDESIQMEMIDARTSNDINSAYRRLSEALYDGDIFVKDDPFSLEYVFDNQIANELNSNLHQGVYELYGRPGKQLVIDADGRNWNSIMPPDELGMYGPQKTRDIAAAAKAHNYDSVLIKNLRDSGGATTYNSPSDVYIFFDANDVKSADPVTYDDQGNVIPLNERFNTEEPDIRFSLEDEDGSNPVVNEGGAEIDTRTKSAYQYSYNSWNRSDYVTKREEMARELAANILGGETRENLKKAEKWIDDINNVAARIAADRNRLDYVASPGRTSFKSNPEYGGSIDSSTICAKRRLQTGTIDAIQNAMPDFVMQAEDLLRIRNMMKERGYEVSCGLCFVESSRKNIAKYANQFRQEWNAAHPENQLTMPQINTVVGLEDTRLNNKEAYEAYEKFMNKLAQRKPKLFEMRTEYNNDILRHFRTDASIEAKNRNGGMRINSFSDFEIVHLIDMMQVIMDMANVGLNGQAYTKVKEFAEALGPTGLKINMSLIAKGVDENGKLIFDEVEGMKWADVEEMRNEYADNVGSIVVVFSEDQLMAAMADDRIDFIIPFHRSQWSRSNYAAIGLPDDAKDFTYWQNERYAKPVYGQKKDGSLKKLRATNYMPNEYWDFSKTGKENAEAYLQMCKENNKIPKFWKWLQPDGEGGYKLKDDGSTDGYWKLLIDFKMYNHKTGLGAEQRPVRPVFGMDAAERMLKEYKGGHSSFPVAQDVVNDFVAEKSGKKGGIKKNGRRVSLEGPQMSIEEEGPDANEWIMGLDADDLTSEGAEFFNSRASRELIRNYQGAVREVREIEGTLRENREKLAAAKGDEARALRNRIQVEENKLNRARKNLAELSENDRLGWIMQRAQNTMDAFMRGKNQAQVQESVEKLKGQAAEARQIAADAAAALDKLADREARVMAMRYFDADALKQAAKELRDGFGRNVTEAITLDEMQEALAGIAMKMITEDKSLSADIQRLTKRIYRETAGRQFGMTVAGYETETEKGIQGDIVQAIFETVSRIMPGTEADPAAQQAVKNLMKYVGQMASRMKQTARGMRQIAEITQGLEERGAEVNTATRKLKTDLDRAIKYYDLVNRKNTAQAEARQIEEITRQLESKAAKRLLAEQEKWQKRLETDRQIRKLAQENVSTRRKITTDYKGIANLILNETDQKNVPQHLKGVAKAAIRMILENDAFRTNRKITGFDWQSLLKSRDVLAALDKRDGTDLNLQAIVDHDGGDDDVAVQAEAALEQIRRGIEYYNSDRGRHTVVLEGDKAALEDIYKGMSRIYNMVTAAGTIEIAGRQMETYWVANEVEGDARKKESYKEFTGTLGKAARGANKAVVLENMTPEYFFKGLKNNGLNLIWKGFQHSEDRYGRIMQDAKAKVTEIAEKRGYSSWDTTTKHAVKLANGKTVNLTLEQMMSLVATWKREANLGPEWSQHLEKGGFVFEEKEEKKLFGREAKTQIPVRVNAEDIAQIQDMMTEDQRDYVDDMVGILSKDMAEVGNTASMAMYGIKKYNEDYYFPFQIWNGVKNKASDAGSQVTPTNNNRAAHQSFTKRRMMQARNAVMIGDFTLTCARHINQMATYATMGQSIENFNRALNFRVLEDWKNPELAQERTLESLLEQQYGKDAMAYIRNFLRDVNGGAVQENSGLATTLMSMFKKNAVGGSLSVALQQPLSYIRAATMISPKYMAAAADPKTYKGSFEEMMRHSGVAVIKNMGRFDMNFSAGATAWLSPEQRKSRGEAIYSKIEDATNALPELMDNMTWTRIWTAVKMEQKAANPNADVKSEEFLNKVGERFNEVIRRTQVYDSVLVKSELMRKQGVFSKSLTAFRAEPTLTLNLMMDAIRNFKDKDGKKNLAAVLATFLLGAIGQAAVKGIMGAGRNPDEKKTLAENFAYRFGAAFLSEANPVSLIPGYDNLVDALSGNDINDNAWGMFKTIGTTMKKMWNPPTGEELTAASGYRYLEDTVGQIAQLVTGVPAKNLMRDSRAVVNWFAGGYAKRPSSGAVMKYQMIDQITAQDLMGIIKKQGIADIWDSTASGYYGRIYEAEKNGNTAAAAEMREYMELGKGKTTKDVNSALASLAKKDESRSAAETADWLLDQGYADSTAWITSQFKEGNLSEEDVKKLYKEHFPDKDPDDAIWNYWRTEYSEGRITEAQATEKYKATHPEKSAQDVRNYFWSGHWQDYKDGKISEAEAAKLYRTYHPDAKDTDLGGTMYGLAKEQYLAGDISRSQAEKIYRKYYPQATADDVWWAMDKLDYQKTTGKSPSGDYYRMNDAIEGNKAAEITKAVEQVLAHGKKKNGVLSSLKTKWEETYLNMKAGSPEKVRLKDAMIKALKAAGYTAAEAEKQINSWGKSKKK